MEKREGLFVLNQRDRQAVARDLVRAFEELMRSPGSADRILYVLNNRLRPLGVRVELTHPPPDRLVADQRQPGPDNEQ